MYLVLLVLGKQMKQQIFVIKKSRVILNDDCYCRCWIVQSQQGWRFGVWYVPLFIMV